MYSDFYYLIYYRYLCLILVKYCKYKSVDISKCINSGTIPKRGNPNEKNEEDELEKELKMINNEEVQKQQQSINYILLINLLKIFLKKNLKISIIKNFQIMKTNKTNYFRVSLNSF